MGRFRQYLIIYFCAFVGPLPSNAIFSMTTELKTTFSASLDQIYLSIPAFVFPFAIFQLFSGSISDHWNRRLTLVLGLLVYALSSAGIALSDSFLLFILFRIGQGVGYAFVGPVTVAILGDMTDTRRFGLAMGIYGTSIASALSLGPLVGGFLASSDWRLAFGLFSILAFLGMILVIVGLSGAETRTKTRESILRNLRTVIKDRNISLASIIGALTFFATIGIVSFLAEELRLDRFNYTAADVGMVITFSGVPGIFMSPLAGGITDRCSPRLTILIGILLMTPTTIVFTWADQFYEFVLLLAIVGTGMAFVTAGLLTISIEEIPILRGTCSSVFNSSRFSGYALSPILLSPVYIVSGYSWIIIICVIALIISLLFSLFLSGKACKIGSQKASILTGTNNG